MCAGGGSYISTVGNLGPAGVVKFLHGQLKHKKLDGLGGQSNLLRIGLSGLVSPLFYHKSQQFWFAMLQHVGVLVCPDCSERLPADADSII